MVDIKWFQRERRRLLCTCHSYLCLWIFFKNLLTWQQEMLYRLLPDRVPVGSQHFAIFLFSIRNSRSELSGPGADLGKQAFSWSCLAFPRKVWVVRGSPRAELPHFLSTATSFKCVMSDVLLIPKHRPARSPKRCQLSHKWCVYCVLTHKFLLETTYLKRSIQVEIILFGQFLKIIASILQPN